MPAADPLARYLRRFAEPEAALAAAVPAAFDAVLVIPAFRESPAFVERLFDDLAEEPAFLLVLVVNQPDHLPDDAETAALWRALGGGEGECIYRQRGRHGRPVRRRHARWQGCAPWSAGGQARRQPRQL